MNKFVDFNAGEVILIDKEIGYTSFDVVNKIKKNLKVKKIGHAGTLDPLATGLLILCTGKKTKDIYQFQEDRKEYSGIIEIGKTTDTLDAEGSITSESDASKIDLVQIREAVKKLTGTIFQIPPMYSALKYKGKSLYKYARKGVEVERKERQVEIYKFDITSYNNPEIEFVVECSKGTYVRTLADDLGRLLEVGAYLKRLRRTKIGNYSVDEAIKVSEMVNFYSENNLNDN